MRTIAAALLLLSLSLPPPARGQEDTTFQSVEVKPGDTLWSISNKWLKDPTKWDQILKFNKLPSKDPTVALPGMTLRIPVHFIKESMRAAYLISMKNEVLFRRKQTVKWEAAKEKMMLFQGDTLRSLANASAVVEFLNKETLSINANSMAVIKPADKAYDIELTNGSIMASNAIIHTPGAVITPATKNARYMAAVRDDKTTVVAVFEGKASVKAAGKTATVDAGKGMEIALGEAPGAQVNIADLPDIGIRSAQIAEAAALLGWKPPDVKPLPTAAAQAPKAASMAEITQDVQKVRLGVPVSAYRVQISPAQDFSSIAFDKYFEPDVPFNPSTLALPPGSYWGRIALVDLLGSEGKFSVPKQYTVGGGKAAPRRRRR
ncbi:MAG: LysM peptidoglycan-binding domain-containing protein [Elusimicrobia bacterium]|nr:LysM peptidoglycan-binding domain-containing protein [Elusimicrobiota bacterium]